MLTMRQVWRATPYDRKERAQNVRVVKLKYGMHKVAKVPIAAATTYSLESDKGRPTWFQYVTAIQFLPKRYVKLSCSCPDFCFRWEVALHRQGAADIKFSNGEHPGVRNPGLTTAACLAKGSLVQTTRGQVPIEYIRIGDQVLTLNGYHRVSAAGLTRRGAKTLVVKAGDSRLELTPDHLVLALRYGDARPHWIEAGALTLNHLLISCLPEPRVLERKDLDQEALVLGYLVSEEGELGYAPLEQECMEEFAEAYEVVAGQGFGAAHKNVIQAKDVLGGVWSKLGVSPTSCQRKELPEYVFQQTFEYRASLLYALFQGDGWIARDSRAATYGTQSKKLAEQIVMLLAGLGYHSSITENVTGACNRLMYLVRLSAESARQLSLTIPQPSKYPEDYFVDSEAASTRRVPFDPVKLYNLVLRFHHHHQLEHACASTRIVAIRDFASEVGVGVDTLMRNCRKYAPRGLLKVRKKGVAKPLFAMKEKDLFRLALKLFPRRWRLPYLSGEGTGMSVAKLNTWLDKLPSSLDSVKDFYGRLTDPGVRYMKVKSIQEGCADVYDLTVPGVEQFTANGIVVHNCKHLIALYTELVNRGIID